MVKEPAEMTTISGQKIFALLGNTFPEAVRVLPQ